METSLSRNQLVLAFSVVLFLVVGAVSATSFTDIFGWQVFYLVAACILIFFILSFALAIHLILEWSK